MYLPCVQRLRLRALVPAAGVDALFMSSGEAPVEIVPYDPSWPGLFDEEQKTLLQALGAWLAGPI